VQALDNNGIYARNCTNKRKIKRTSVFVFLVGQSTPTTPKLAWISPFCLWPVSKADTKEVEVGFFENRRAEPNSSFSFWVPSRTRTAR
jgi:hypothetical protein